MFARTLRTQLRPAKPGRTPLARSFPRLRIQRNVHYNQYPILPPVNQPSRFKKLLYFAMALVTVGTFGYYFFWPKHTFPLLVAKILRKGLWAESNKGDADWELALKHYLEALAECDKLDMDRLSDEYTGIQLKIAEMYERLGNYDDVVFLLTELNTHYLLVLTAPPDSEYGRKIRSQFHREHLIQRALRTILKAADFMDGMPQVLRASLFANYVVAHDNIKLKMAGDIVAAAVSEKEDFRKYKERLPFESNPDAFYPYAEEYFALCDLMAIHSYQVGDLETALWARMQLTTDMMSANMAPDKLMLSQCNTASALYMVMEEREATLYRLEKIWAENAGIPVESWTNRAKLSADEKAALEKKVYDHLTEEETSSRKHLEDSIKQLTETALMTYKAVATGCDNIPISAQYPEIRETASLATYGMGVISLHTGKLDDAERFLREARVRARKAEYQMLMPEIELEMEKLKQERANRASVTSEPPKSVPQAAVLE